MGVITPNQFKRGSKLDIDGEPFSVVEYLHIKTGRGGATVRTKIKSLISGNVLERSFRSDEKLPQPDFEEKKMSFLYADGDELCFMDNESFEQASIPKDELGNSYLYLPENTEVTVQIYNGKIVGIELPNFIDLEVAQTDPGFKGNTVTGGNKPATLSTGGVVNVPLFINEGDVLKIDTRTITYIERVKSASK